MIFIKPVRSDTYQGSVVLVSVLHYSYCSDTIYVPDLMHSSRVNTGINYVVTTSYVS